MLFIRLFINIFTQPHLTSLLSLPPSVVRVRTMSTRNTIAPIAGISFITGIALAVFVSKKFDRQVLEDNTIGHHHSLLLENNSDNEDGCIYLDYNGTTPIYPSVLKAMMPYLTLHYGNPSSSHAFGSKPRQAVETGRRQILDHLLQSPTAPTTSIWFTSCGTESDNLAILLALSCAGAPKNHIVTCNVEHAAIDLCLQQLQAQNRCTVTRVPVQPDGCVLACDVIAAITKDTCMVTIMLANNEVGACQPVAQIADYCRQKEILMHTDAAQAAGKVSVALHDIGQPDMVSLVRNYVYECVSVCVCAMMNKFLYLHEECASIHYTFVKKTQVGHKLGASKGVACLYVRDGCLSEAGRTHNKEPLLLIGGGQEHGNRAGTENVASIVGMGHAALLAGQHLEQNSTRMEELRMRLLTRLQEKLGADNVRANGPTNPSSRLPNTLSVGLRNVDSGELLRKIGNQVAASAGATCHSACGVSSVLRAMNVPDEFAK
jgi:cysteine desulfurase